MKKEDIKIEKLLDIDETIAKSLFEKYVYPFEVLKESQVLNQVKNIIR